MKGTTEALALEHTLTVRDSILRESLIQGQKISAKKQTRFYVLSKKQYVSKRVLDLGGGFLGLMAFAVLYPFIALGIKLSSGGPVLYKQKRTGCNGYPFICYKFRTMHRVWMKPDTDKPDITKIGDPRIFGFGKILRKLNLDELPQIINVFRGEMSLVGPRPYPVKECAYWNTAFDDFYYRYAVKPGISGLAQSKGYRGGTFNEDHMRKRLDYDLIYVEKSSMILDLKIIGDTILQMIHLDTNAH